MAGAGEGSRPAGYFLCAGLLRASYSIPGPFRVPNRKNETVRAQNRSSQWRNMADDKNCARPACSCQAREGSNYCSTYCEGAGKTPEITCQCGHPGCSGKV